MTEFLAFMKAIPEMIGVVTAILVWLKKVSGNDPAGLASRINQSFTNISNAKTPEDHANEAKNLASIIAQFPPK